MMALASAGPMPAVLVPGASHWLARFRRGMPARVQTIGARFAQEQITLEYATESVAARVRVLEAGGQFLGTAATSQVGRRGAGTGVAAYGAGSSGMPNLARCGEALGRALLRMHEMKIGVKDVLTRGSQKCDGCPCGVRRIDDFCCNVPPLAVFCGMRAKRGCVAEIESSSAAPS